MDSPKQERAPRQTTPQPQEQAPDVGQPHVPHRTIHVPGAPESPASDRDAPEEEE